MTFSAQNDFPNLSGPLALSGSLAIAAIGQLHDLLAERLQSQSGLVLDLHKIDSCDAAAVQLLCAVHKTAVQAHIPCRVTALSPAIEECCTALGVRLQDLGAGDEPGGFEPGTPDRLPAGSEHGE